MGVKLDLEQLRRQGQTPHYYVAPSKLAKGVHVRCGHREPGPNGVYCGLGPDDPIHLKPRRSDPAAV